MAPPACSSCVPGTLALISATHAAAECQDHFWEYTAVSAREDTWTLSISRSDLTDLLRGRGAPAPRSAAHTAVAAPTHEPACAHRDVGPPPPLASGELAHAVLFGVYHTFTRRLQQVAAPRLRPRHDLA